MEPLKKWLVGLDLTDHDHSILAYTKLLSEALCPDHIEFVYISHRFADEVHIHLPETLKYPDYDDLVEKLKNEVYEIFPEKDNVSCKVLDGPIQFDLWKESYVQDIDLFIAGSKPRHKGRGLFPRKFVRKSFCSVLLIPKELREKIAKIWVPVDFSYQSGRALQLAIKLSKDMEPTPEVCAHHVYQLPHAYYFKGFPREQILDAVKKSADQQFEKFTDHYNPQGSPLTSCMTELDESYAANSIKSEAEAAESDLIIMSSGGRSRFAKFFLGSETEYLVQKQTTMPLLILKKKEEQVKLWDLFSVDN